MECVEARRALKSSLQSETFMIQQAAASSLDDVNSDEFSVDDLLDLSDKDFAEDFASQDNDNDSISSSSSIYSAQFSTSGDLLSLTAQHLTVPIDDMESLEWLSQIVDDSVPELPILSPAMKLNDSAVMIVNRSEPPVNLSSRSFTVLGLPYPVPVKCRTERSRRPGRLWSPGSLSESSSTSSSCHESSVTSPLLFRIPVYSTTVFEKQPVAKKQRKNPTSQNRLGSSESLSQRRCTHCQVQKTPQWRTGPLGPKTLCNACGVRFKSGRLYPEYRPACSPTFSGDVHSNSHRRVLELRKKEKGVEPVSNMAVQ